MIEPETQREHIISLQGSMTGMKKDLKHLHQDVEKLGGKIDKIYWVVLATVGAVAFQLLDKYVF
jgi:hypothetical protein